jgi:hypothetical protein
MRMSLYTSLYTIPLYQMRMSLYTSHLWYADVTAAGFARSAQQMRSSTTCSSTTLVLLVALLRGRDSCWLRSLRATDTAQMRSSSHVTASGFARSAQQMRSSTTCTSSTLVLLVALLLVHVTAAGFARSAQQMRSSTTCSSTTCPTLCPIIPLKATHFLG